MVRCFASCSNSCNAVSDKRIPSTALIFAKRSRPNVKVREAVAWVFLVIVDSNAELPNYRQTARTATAELPAKMRYFRRSRPPENVHGLVASTFGLSRFLPIRPNKAFQPIPTGIAWLARKWVRQPDFFQCVVHPGEVAGCTGDHHVRVRVVAASGVRQHVVILQPNGLERRMLAGIGLPPRESLGKGLHHTYADFLANNRHAAKPTMVAVTTAEKGLFGAPGIRTETRGPLGTGADEAKR